MHTGVRVGRGAVIGAHALILCPSGRTLTIGEEAVIGAGAIVVSDVPARAVVIPSRAASSRGDPIHPRRARSSSLKPGRLPSLGARRAVDHIGHL